MNTSEYYGKRVFDPLVSVYAVCERECLRHWELMALFALILLFVVAIIAVVDMQVLTGL